MYYPDMRNWNPVNMTDEEIAARDDADRRKLADAQTNVKHLYSSDDSNAQIWDAVVAASGGHSESSD